MPADPWTFSSGRAHTETLVKPTLIARARKRLDDIHASDVDPGHYIVAGRDDLGDAAARYTVHHDGAQVVTCSCWSTLHGQSRERRGCSHAIAVVLWLKERGAPVNPSSSPPEGAGVPRVDVPARQAEVPLQPRAIGPAPLDVGEGWPDWLHEFREHQLEAADAVVEQFRQGAQVVFLDAPTGSGKTLIGELVRRRMGGRAVYVCTDKGLQQQVARDFPYARVLWGRANYVPLQASGDVTCADCDRVPGDPQSCSWCESTFQCPYLVARSRALRADLAVLNTAYLLHAANYAGTFSGGELVVADECDQLERVLLGFEELRVGPRTMEDLGVDQPVKGAHHGTVAGWLGDLGRVVEQRLPEVGEGLRADRTRRRLEELALSAARVSPMVGREEWVRDYPDDGAFVLRPVIAREFASKRLWDHAKKWLCMSATVISAEEMAESLGVEKWASVQVPMTFPVEHRWVYAAPVADMSQRAKEAGEWERMVVGVARVLARHPDEKVLVHTVSYALTRHLLTGLRTHRRNVLAYNRASERAHVLETFRASRDGVLLAPSMERGVDLPGDLCRVVVIAKVPYPYLGDKQVSARMHMPGGRLWYAVQTVRDIVQMTGRAVRSEDDWATGYILDASFTRKLWPEWKQLFPRWWREGLRMDFDMREFR